MYNFSSTKYGRYIPLLILIWLLHTFIDLDLVTYPLENFGQVNIHGGRLPHVFCMNKKKTLFLTNFSKAHPQHWFDVGC